MLRHIFLKDEFNKLPVMFIMEYYKSSVFWKYGIMSQGIIEYENMFIAYVVIVNIAN